METLKVVCAVISAGNVLKERAGQILIAQRKPGTHLSGFWEFPGGKIHDSETLEKCLAREVYEELGVRVMPRRLIAAVRHKYPLREVVLYFYLCEWVCGQPFKKDCHDFRWVQPEELLRFRFPPADTGMIQELIRKKRLYFG